MNTIEYVMYPKNTKISCLYCGTPTKITCYPDTDLYSLVCQKCGAESPALSSLGDVVRVQKAARKAAGDSIKEAIAETSVALY